MTGKPYTTSGDQSVNAERAALQKLRSEIVDSIAHMDSRILDLASWGQVLMHLGASADWLEPDAISVVGASVQRAAEYLRDEMREARQILAGGAQA